MQRYVILLAVIGAVAAGCGGEDATDATDATVAKNGDSVAVHYVGTLDDGSEFDSSRTREPLIFEVGTDEVIAGFDRAVNGMAVGDVATVRIPPADAYGEIDPELVFSVPIEEAPEDVAPGDEVLIGGVTTGVVTAVTLTEVTIDTNHRFAGQALTFEIELVSINE